MTDKEKLNAIKAEVQNYIEAAHKAHTNITEGNFAHLLSFIDSLQEEPVSEDLIEELKKIVNIRECVSQGVPVIKIARHFANWQKEQMMKDAVDGTAQTYLPFESIRFIGKPLRELGLKTNNPVKVIIIKEN